MRAASRYFGIIGIVSIIFGILSFVLDLLQGKGASLSLYPIINSIVGVVFLVLYLVFNSGSLKSSMKERSTLRGTNAFIYVFLLFGILVFANVIFVTEPTFNAKIDLTADKVFSLESQSINITKNLKEEITVIGFYNVGVQERIVLKDIVDRYRYYSDKIKLELFDADENPGRAKELEVSNGMAVIVGHSGKKNILQGLDEQNITNGLIQITKGADTFIYFTTGHGEGDIKNEEATGYNIIAKYIENEGYTSKNVDLGKEAKVPADAALLIVVGPKNNFSTDEIAKIKSYLDGGGNAFFMLEPIFDVAKTKLIETGFEGILSEYGIGLGSEVIMFAPEIPEFLRAMFGSQVRPEVHIASYEQHEITKDFNGKVVLQFTRPLTKITAATAPTVESIIKVDGPVYWGEKNFNSIFQGNAKKDSNDTGAPFSVLMTSMKNVGAAKNSKVVVIGNASFISNQRLGGASNHNLFLNCLNWLNGEVEKISVRPKMIKSSRINWAPQEASFVFYLCVLAIPQLILLFGLLVWYWRKRR